MEFPVSVRPADMPLPAVLYIRVTPESGAGHTHVLEASREQHPVRQTATWDGGRLLVTTFEPMHEGEGTGSFPSVTTFLSDAWVEVSHRGVRRRFGVRAGDAFWFGSRSRLTVLSDDPVGAAIVQIDSR
jgi:hypothetical protein